MSAAMWAALSLLCAGACLLSARATAAELTVNAIGTWGKAGLRALGAPEEEQGAGVFSGNPDPRESSVGAQSLS